MPRETVPFLPEAVPTGLTIATPDNDPYIIIAGNDKEGPFLLLKRFESEPMDVVFDQKITVPGNSISTIPLGQFTCSSKEKASYYILISRMGPEMNGSPVKLTCDFRGSQDLDFDNNYDFSLSDGPYSFRRGDMLTRSFRNLPSSFEASITSASVNNSVTKA